MKRKLTIKAAILLLGLFLNGSVFGQHFEWAKNSEFATFKPNTSIRDAQNPFFNVGQNNGGEILKWDDNGNEIWQKSFGVDA